MQSSAVLMAMVQVVLKWWNSTAYQSHNYESFVIKFGEGDQITRINNPAKFDLNRISGGAPTLWWNISGSRAIYYIFVFVFYFLATRAAHTREPGAGCSTHNASDDRRSSIPGSGSASVEYTTIVCDEIAVVGHIQASV